MAPRVEADDLLRVGPGGDVRDVDGRVGQRVVGFVVRVERADGDGQSAVYGVGAGVRADGVAGFDRVVLPAAHDGAALGGRRCAPVYRYGLDARLIGVGCVKT